MKKLSLILCSRNDTYGGNPMQRLEKVLNHLGEVIHGKPAEVVVSDWGSNVPIEKAIEITPKARRITKFIYIPKVKTAKVNSPFSEVHALNVAARHAIGQFVGRIDQDILVGYRFIEWMFSQIPDTTKIYWSARRDFKENQKIQLEPESVATGLAFECSYRKGFFRTMIERILLPNKPFIRKQFWRTAVGIFLIPRNFYVELGGYNEQNIYKSHMEHEFIVRLSKVGQVVDLGSELNYDFYHLWHHRNDRNASVDNQWLSYRRLSRLPLQPNSLDWGKL